MHATMMMMMMSNNKNHWPPMECKERRKERPRR